MAYLISQIITCLVISALIGVGVGAALQLIASASRARRQGLRHEQRFAACRRERDEARRRVTTLGEELDVISERLRLSEDSFSRRLKELEQEKHNLREKLEILKDGLLNNPAPKVEPVNALKADAPQATSAARRRMKTSLGALGAKVGMVSSSAAAETAKSLIEQVSIEKSGVNSGAEILSSTDGSFMVERVCGIERRHKEKLREINIFTTKDLLEKCRSSQNRRFVAQRVGVSERTLEKWAALADLMRVPGIETEYSSVLEASGVHSVQELADRDAEHLFADLLKRTEASSGLQTVPSIRTVEAWIHSAKSLPAAVI